MEKDFIQLFGPEEFDQMQILGYSKFSRLDITEDQLIEVLSVSFLLLETLPFDKKHYLVGPWYIFKHIRRGRVGYGIGRDPDLNQDFNIFDE